VRGRYPTLVAQGDDDLAPVDALCRKLSHEQRWRGSTGQGEDCKRACGNCCVEICRDGLSKRFGERIAIVTNVLNGIQ
jgi:hypothetical protein